jgi:hypothetical protein
VPGQWTPIGWDPNGHGGGWGRQGLAASIDDGIRFIIMDDTNQILNLEFANSSSSAKLWEGAGHHRAIPLANV